LHAFPSLFFRRSYISSSDYFFLYDLILQVEHTKLRPVASGLLTPFQGLSFLGFQLLLGLGILLQLNNYRLVLMLSAKIYG